MWVAVQLNRLRWYVDNGTDYVTETMTRDEAESLADQLNRLDSRA